MRLGVTLAIAMVGNVGMWSIIVVMPAVQGEFGIDRAGVALPYTVTMLGFALGNALVGRIVDRYGVTWALIASAILIAAGNIVGAAASSIQMLTVMQFVIGLGTAASFGPLIADISHWFNRRRGIAVAVTASGNYLSGAIWPILLAGVMQQYGWRGVYQALAAITLIVVIPLALVLGRRKMDGATKRAGGPMAAGHAATRFSARGLSL